jgi:transcriptional regulator with XRE-family HTH domain
MAVVRQPGQGHENAVEHIANRQDFADALTKVRERAGLTVRDLAKATGVPLATVGDYLSGAHLPSLKLRHVLTKILNACGITDPAALDQWWDALIRVRRPPGRRPASA